VLASASLDGSSSNFLAFAINTYDPSSTERRYR
jgi:hypothetical protein